MELWQQVAIGVIPSIGVALIFWFAMRAVVRADRNERAALAQIDAEEAAATTADVDAQRAPSNASATDAEAGGGTAASETTPHASSGA
ncbi:hypothetical protein [Demequina flava]|uniref:hypothetical protein n=1 Tax=Demequina flava TaxID=1095025 RepID=UPI000783A509|nr:hypothetical protein [Demequina flava]